MGNTTSHKLAEIKPREVDIIDFGGVEMIIANGRGVSLRTLDEIIKKGLSGWAWKFEKGTIVTADLKLVTDEPGHYMLAPIHNTPPEDYKGLLNKMGEKCSKYLYVNKDGTIKMAPP